MNLTDEQVWLYLRFINDSDYCPWPLTDFQREQGRGRIERTLHSGVECWAIIDKLTENDAYPQFMGDETIIVFHDHEKGINDIVSGTGPDNATALIDALNKYLEGKNEKSD